MKRAVLFDLGNTLVDYFTRDEFPALLDRAISEAREFLVEEMGVCRVSLDEAAVRARAENYSAPDHRVRPLEGCLERIFELAPGDLAMGAMSRLCRRFMAPILATGRLRDDALPVLARLRESGIRTAIVSNTCWGSAAEFWREQTDSLGLAAVVDARVFCRDVGWRKPAAPIFEEAMRQLEVSPADCLFVGDEARWDIAGPRALGMDAVLLDRAGANAIADVRCIRSLWEVLDLL